MAKTLVDEPPPSTLSEPGNRPTLDDIPAAGRPTLDDIPGARRGPSPTLVDPPAPAAAPQPGAAPTLADAPGPHTRFVTTAESATGPVPQAQPAPQVAVGLPVPPAPALPAAPAPAAALPAAPAPAAALPAAPAPAAALPAATPPPPLAHPAGGAQGAGLLAQLPAMPSTPVAGAPRMNPGGRTLLGVAPPPPTHATAPPGGHPAHPASAQAPAPHQPPVQPGQPAEAAVSPAPGNGAPPGPEAAPGNGAPPGPEAAPGNSPSPAPRKSSARAVVAAVVAVIGLLAIVAVVAGYLVFFRYTPLAERHIPAQSNVAFRADLRQIATFAPVRKHLWPLLLDRPSQKTQGKTFADKVADATGIHAAVDVREIIVASVDSRSWVALVGGNLKPGTFVSGMEKVLQEEGYPGWQRRGDLLVGPAGVALAQADDGTLVIGTEVEIVNSALPASEEHHRMNLPTNAALSFVVTKEAWEELSRDAGPFDAAGSLRRIRHLRGTLSLGDEPAMDLEIEPKGGENADALGKDLETMLAALRLFLVLAPDRMGEKAALSAARVAVEEQRVRVRAPWPVEGLDRACAELAARLR